MVWVITFADSADFISPEGLDSFDSVIIHPTTQYSVLSYFLWAGDHLLCSFSPFCTWVMFVLALGVIVAETWPDKTSR
jgi:hypothetical protein